MNNMPESTLEQRMREIAREEALKVLEERDADQHTRLTALIGEKAAAGTTADKVDEALEAYRSYNQSERPAFYYTAHEDYALMEQFKEVIVKNQLSARKAMGAFDAALKIVWREKLRALDETDWIQRSELLSEYQEAVRKGHV